MKSVIEKTLDKFEWTSPKLLVGLGMLVVISIYLAVQIGTEVEKSTFMWYEWLLGTVLITAIYFAGYVAGKDQQIFNSLREQEGEYLQGEC